MGGQRYSGVVAITIAMIVSLWAVEADAQRTRTAEVPVQIGVGPAGVMLGGPIIEDQTWGGVLFEEQPVHSGLRIGLTAVVDSELVADNPGLVPSQYEGQIERAGEVRYAPGIVGLIPSSLYLSPGVGNASVWGATWSLIGVGLAPISDPVRFSGKASGIVSAKYIRSQALDSSFVFLRPGVELNFDLEFPIAERFLVSVGWSSLVHIPQPYDGGILDLGEFDGESLWHVGQFYMQFHFRVPYAHEYRVRR